MKTFEVAIEHTQTRIFTVTLEAESEDKARREAESRARCDVADRENEYVKNNHYTSEKVESIKEH